jgi:glycine betaine/proline transport system ATP-binding protein
MTYQVKCKNLWKIYGARADEALRAIKERGLGKDEAKQQFNCVIGVQDVSFEVSEGDIFCIMGLSGSGKSTLVRHVNRLIEPTAGEVIVNGQSISNLDEKALRQLRSETIGMVFQHMALWPHRTIRDNVAFGLEIRGIDKAKRYRTADQALEMVQLSGWEEHYPDELSGGMQQRVGLARALAADPEILLMDEPFSALDPLIRRQLQDQFLELSEVMKKTTLFITHDLDEAIRLGNRIAIMNQGKIVQIGTPEEIVTNPKDEYVADFVGGISRLQLVYAHTVMQAIEAYKATHGDDLVDSPQVPLTADLNHLIDVVVDTDRPLVVMDDGTAVGVITNRAILRAIQGRNEEVQER